MQHHLRFRTHKLAKTVKKLQKNVQATPIYRQIFHPREEQPSYFCERNMSNMAFKNYSQCPTH